MQEILVVVVIALAIFFLPRLLGRKSTSDVEQHSIPQQRFQARAVNRVSKISLTGRLRLAILITILWILANAAFFKPWGGHPMLIFILVSLGPVIVFWGGVWVWFGYKKYRR